MPWVGGCSPGRGAARWNVRKICQAQLTTEVVPPEPPPEGDAGQAGSAHLVQRIAWSFDGSQESSPGGVVDQNQHRPVGGRVAVAR